MNLRKIAIFIAIMFSTSLSYAQYGQLDQYRAELGVIGGASFYIGDANPNKLFNRSGLAIGALCRYNFNPRYALKLSIVHAEVAGDTRDYPNKFPHDQFMAFKRSFWDVGLNFEFNFVDYGLPGYSHDNKWFSPYIFIGAGFTSSSAGDSSDSFRLNFNMPFGAGVKLKLNYRFNIGLEWSMHTLFVDDFDVAGYQDPLFDDLDNPYGFEGISSTKNNDRYSIAKVFISIDMFKRKHCK